MDSRSHNQEDNRFTRAYIEHKREKQIEHVKPDYNNRFACLKENNAPIRRDAGRFECLRGDVNINPSESQDSRFDNRFSCLASDGYQSYPREEYVSKPVYLPRPEPRESVNSRMKRYQEEERIKKPITQVAPPPPVFSFESNFHFPELGKTPDVPTNSKMPQAPKEVKLPEPKAPKEMITHSVIIPIKKKTMTLISLEKGKYVQKEVFEDGTDIPESGIVMVKKPNYSSWASVLKPEMTETIYYDLDDKKIIDTNETY
jgi:hypothetical protein